MTFVVFSLPRSRSTWLSLFLSYKGRVIGHDIGSDCASPEDFLDRLGEGTCETGAVFAWRRIREARPDCKFVLVYRRPQDVCASLERFGLNGYWAEMHDRLLFMDQIAAQEPQTLVLSYDDLTDPSKCAKLFEYCLDEPFDLDWWVRMDAINVQTDMPKQLGKLIRNHAKLEALKDDLRRRA